MHFVDDIDLVAGRSRRITHAVQQLAHLINLGAAGGVQLQHVDMAQRRGLRLPGQFGCDAIVGGRCKDRVDRGRLTPETGDHPWQQGPHVNVVAAGETDRIG